MQSPFGGNHSVNNSTKAEEAFDNIDELRNQASKKLIESGERDRLMRLLKQRLMESGWRDELAAECKKVVRARGVDNITVDDLVQEVQPFARRRVPDEIRKELVDQIKNFLMKVMMSDE